MINNYIRGWIPSGLKRIGKKILCEKTVGKILMYLYGNEIPTKGFKILTDSPRISEEKKASIFWGIHERVEIAFVDRYLKKRLDVVELGGSIGVVSCHILAKRNKLIVVEADPELASILKKNLAFNFPEEKNYEIIQKAVSYNKFKNNRVAFNSGKSFTGGQLSKKNDNDNRSIQYIEFTTLSEIIREYGINDYILVVDIEGGEAALLNYEKVSLKKCQQIIIELHDTEFEGKEITILNMVEMIKKIGFHLTDNYGPVFVFDKLN